MPGPLSHTWQRPHLAVVTGNPGQQGGMQTFSRFVVQTACAADWRVTIALSGMDLYSQMTFTSHARPQVETVDWVDKDFTGDRRYEHRTIRERYRWFRWHQPDVALFVQSSNTPFRASLVAARLAGVRVVMTHRTMPWMKEFVPRGRHCFGLVPGLGLHNRRQVLKTRVAALASDRIVYNSEAVREAYERDYGYPARKGRVIPNATTVPALPKEHDRGRDVITIGYVGRLAEEKRVDVLIRAMAELRTRRPARLVIYGDGPERDNLSRIVDALGLADRVLFRGHTEDPWLAYADMDIVVLCSRREASSNMVLEAMAAGKAVIVSNVGGLPELIGLGRWGLCFEVGDVAGLARALDGLIDHDAERLRIGRLARLAACQSHDPKLIGENWITLFAELIKDRTIRGTGDLAACGRRTIAAAQE